jgi:Domain of unknown function (DUF4190)
LSPTRISGIVAGMVYEPPPGGYPYQPQQGGFGPPQPQQPPGGFSPAQPAQGYGGWQVPPYTPRATTNGLAVAALILGVLGFFGISLVLSIILGCVALSQIKRRGQRGKAAAIIGIVLSVVWAGLLILVIVLAIRSEPKRDSAGQVTKSGSLSVFDLRVNDCFDGVSDGQTTSDVTVKPCTQPHDAQMIDKITAPGGTFPGSSSLFTSGQQKCQRDEQSRLAKSPIFHQLRYFVLSPNQQAWDDGNHTIACAVVDKDNGKLPGPIDGG